MWSAKVLLITCLVAVAAITVVDSSERENKPDHHVLTHRTTHHKHKPTTVSSVVEHPDPPLEGPVQDSVQLKKQPPIAVNKVEMETQPKRHSEKDETMTSKPSPVNGTDTPPQVVVTDPLTHHKNNVMLTSKVTEVASTKLEASTTQSARHSSMPTTDYLVTQLGVPRPEELTQSMRHTTEPSEMFTTMDLASPSLESDEHQSAHQNNMTVDSRPKQHDTHHLAHHKNHLPINSTQDYLEGSLSLHSVNHQPIKLTTAFPISEQNILRHKEVTHSVTNLNQEEKASSTTNKSENSPHEAKTHQSVHHHKQNLTTTSPKIESIVTSGFQVKSQSSDMKNEQNAASPLIKSDITANEAHLLPSDRHQTTASENVVTEPTPMTLPPASENINPNKSMHKNISKETTGQSEDVSTEAHLNLERNETQFNVLPQPTANVEISSSQKIDSKDPSLESSYDNKLHIDMREDMSGAETNRYVATVKPLKSGHGNRLRTRHQEDRDENKSMTRERDVNPFDNNTRPINNRHQMTKFRQRGSKERPLIGESKPILERVETEAVRENSKNRHHDISRSGYRRTTGSKQLNEVNDRQLTANETDPNQGNVRPATSAKRGNARRTTMQSVPRRSSDDHVKATLNQQQLNDDTKSSYEDTNIGKLERRGHKQRDYSHSRPRQTEGNNILQRRVADQNVKVDETREMRWETELAALKGRENNRRDRTFKGPSENVGKRLKERGSQQTFEYDETRPTQRNRKTAALEDRQNSRRVRTRKGPSESAGKKELKVRFSEQTFLEDETREHMNMDSSEERDNKSNDSKYTGPSGNVGDKKHKAQYSEQTFEDDETRPTSTETLEERKTHKRDRTSLVQRRTSGNNQVKPRVSENEDDVKPNQEDIEVDTLEGRHSSRRTGQKRPSVNKRAEERFKGQRSLINEGRNTETGPLEEHSNKRHNPPSVGLRRSSSDNQFKMRVAPLDLETDLPETGHSQTEENVNKRTHRPSAALRHTSRSNHGNAETADHDQVYSSETGQASDRRVSRRKQSHHRSDVSAEEEDTPRIE